MGIGESAGMWMRLPPEEQPTGPLLCSGQFRVMVGDGNADVLFGLQDSGYARGDPFIFEKQELFSRLRFMKVLSPFIACVVWFG